MAGNRLIDLSNRRLICFITGRLGECENCGSREDVQLEAARTAYHFEGEADSPDDPNRRIAYCRPCAVLHHEHWDAMWSEYHASQGY